MTHPTPRNPVSRTEPLELTVVAQLRDRELDICGPIRVTFTYDPSDPYALGLVFQDLCGPDSRSWVGSREVFAAAALWGLALPGLDLTVTPVTVTRATPGMAVRDVPCLRIHLRDVADDGVRHFYTGNDVYLDIVTADVVKWFAMTTQVVQIGHEHRHTDVDAAIADILGPSYKEGS